jgi:hypothetical protein
VDARRDVMNFEKVRRSTARRCATMSITRQHRGPHRWLDGGVIRLARPLPSRVAGQHRQLRSNRFSRLLVVTAAHL